MRRWRRTPADKQNHGQAATVVIEPSPTGVLQVCHPDWRGVRTAAEAFRDPVVASVDLTTLVEPITSLETPPTMLVIQGWPPGAGVLARAAARVGIPVSAVFHSAPTQHGVDGGEAEAVSEMFKLMAEGVIRRVGTVKAGTAPVFRSMGFDVWHVPNRVPLIPEVVPTALSAGTHAGIFLDPYWRKNVTTQILAALRNEWHPHVMKRPDVGYLPTDAITEWGELSHDEFLTTLGSMGITLHVTLSECHPMMPMESYRLGVPCLMSRTSDLFSPDPRLHAATTVAEVDNVEAVAAAAASLLADRDEIVAMANAELDRVDEFGRQRWMAFTDR